MYKSKLQELCHKNAWTLREYRQQRDGPEYSPRFSASPKMAPHASLSFTSLIMRLQEHKKHHKLPTLLRKKQLSMEARVIVDGKTFEATEYYYTVKEAEHAAAKVALKSLVPDGIREDELGIYKNLLQELTQKEGCNLPQYSTFASGEPHMLVFVSTVEVDGKTFQGPQSKTKKEAEMGAAKVAYNCLKESKSPEHPSSTIRLHEEGSSSSSQSSGCGIHLPLKAKIEELTGGPMASNAIRVYPNLPNLTIPPGHTVLTESDNNWVAVTLDNTARNK